MFRLMQRFPLHRTEALYSVNQDCEPLLEREWRDRNLHFLDYSLVDFVGSVRRVLPT